MVGNLKELSDTTFTIDEIIPGYRLERLGNANFLKANARSISSTGTFSKYGKTVYIKSLICNPSDLGDKAFSDIPESFEERCLNLNGKTLYAKAWCCYESE